MHLKVRDQQLKKYVCVCCVCVCLYTLPLMVTADQKGILDSYTQKKTESNTVAKS